LVAAQALAGEYSPVLMDARAHPSLRDAAQLLDCPVKFFRHKDAGVLARAARACGREARPAVFTDGLFAHDGSTAPLPAYQQVLPAAGLLLVDDAHGAGTLGAHGRGTAEHLQVSTRRMVQTVTLSKAFGAYGGAILGPAWLKRKIYARSRMFAGHTPLPLPLVCAARKSLELFSATPALRERLRANAAYVKARLRAAGVPVPDHPGPIVFLAPEKATTAARLIKALRARGV
jgi:7-keto-8-aminopelargonate synthetase-like enzyme